MPRSGRFFTLLLASAMFAVVVGACADSDFVANGVDQERLALLKSGETYAFVSEAMSCKESLAHFERAVGYVEVDGIADNKIECSMHPDGDDPVGAVDETVTRVIALAEGSGWTPSVSSRVLEFWKELDGEWAAIKVSRSVRDGASVFVDFRMPHHDRSENGPVSVDRERGQACVDAVKAGGTAPDICDLAS